MTWLITLDDGTSFEAADIKEAIAVANREGLEGCYNFSMEYAELADELMNNGYTIEQI